MRARRRGLHLLEVGLAWPPEDYLRRKLEGLAARGWRVTVAAEADRRPDTELLPGVGLLPLPQPDELRAAALLRVLRDGARLALRSPGALHRLVRAVRRSRAGGPLARRRTVELLRSHLPVMLAGADVVHFEWEAAALGYVPLFEACRAPVVVSSHGGVQVRPRAGDERLAAAYPVVYGGATVVHCVCEAVKREATRFGLAEGKGRVIHPGVDTGFFRPPARRGAEERGALRVVGVGELNWIKGYDHALAAMALLVREGVQVTYEVLGGEPDARSWSTRDRARLLYLAHDLGLNGRVRLSGRVSQEVVRERLWGADVLLQASLSEGLPNSVLEAMACALPVVVTDCGGLREAVEHGVEGLVCPRRDPEALAGALLELWRDPALGRRLGQAGRSRVDTEFALDRQIDSFERLYEDLAASS